MDCLPHVTVLKIRLLGLVQQARSDSNFNRLHCLRTRNDDEAVDFLYGKRKGTLNLNSAYYLDMLIPTTRKGDLL